MIWMDGSQYESQKFWLGRIGKKPCYGGKNIIFIIINLSARVLHKFLKDIFLESSFPKGDLERKHYVI